MAFTAGTALSASALNDAVGFTTGTAFTTTAPAGSGWYRMVGSQIEGFWASTGTVPASTAVTIDATLPAGYRPAAPTPAAAVAGSSTPRAAGAWVGSDGTIQVFNNHSSATVIAIHFQYQKA